MKIIVIGGVAAGTKAAAKLKRQNRNAEVTIYTKGNQISYAGCALPYYAGGSIDSKEDLIVNTPETYSKLTGVTVQTNMEAIAVHPENKSVVFANGDTVSYDKLIIAAGAVAFVPNIQGTSLSGVFTMRTPDDAVTLRSYIENNSCKTAVVAGAGFIGLEIAENLNARGISVTVVDMASQLLPNLFDEDLAAWIRRHLQSKGIRVVTGAAIEEITGTDHVTGIRTSIGSFSGDLAVLAIGIRPATAFLQDSGIALDKGTILVNEYQETNMPDIYAVGDCAEVTNRITGNRQWSAMGSTANITGRLLARNLTGEHLSYHGCLGTGVVKLSSDLNAGRTGLTEAQALKAGYDVISATCVTDDKAHYYPDASTFITKLIADKATHKLLGLQILGSGAVDKMVDIAVTGLSLGAAVEDFETMDFAYAPPFSTAIHPFAHACGILENKMNGILESFTPAEYAAGKAKDYKIIDVHPTAKILGTMWVNLTDVNGPIEGLEKDAKLLLVCAKGKRSYFLQNRLKSFGYTNTRTLEAGTFLSTVQPVFGSTLPPEEIKRLKGLGCLQDKRYSDVFNVRIITRNGKITAEEHRVIAEASERFGSGAVTMTTRLTLEIQGVKYPNIQPMLDFLGQHGLMAGGTGSLVRPVVSCKGTTCQYGLLDSFGLSEKLHEKFYVGYHGITLPHKFKIAVGGCPNNCVKPTLNDIGIVGQRVPIIDYSKCKGCKKCQVETGCPIHIAHVENGKINIPEDQCNHCGRCKGKCPFGAVSEFQDGFKVYIGGRWGKKIAFGQPLTKLFTSEEEVIDLVEKAILLFRDEGITGERFADTVARLGFDYVNDKLLNTSLDKEQILNKTVRGGATC